MKPKFLIYKGTGGLTHLCRGLYLAMAVAKDMERTLVIDTMSGKAFMQKFSTFFDITDKELQYSESYDNIPSYYSFHDIPIKELEKIGAKWWSKHPHPNNYHLKNIIISNREEFDNTKDIVCYAGPGEDFPKNIKVKKKILRKIKKKKDINEKYISMQFRNTDKPNDIYLLIDKLNQTIQKTKINTLYLATDDFEALDIIREKISGIKIIQYAIPPNFCGENIHERMEDKFLLIYNTLLDMYMIMNSDFFIPSPRSGLSDWIIRMINGDCDDIFDMNSSTWVLN